MPYLFHFPPTSKGKNQIESETSSLSSDISSAPPPVKRSKIKAATKRLLVSRQTSLHSHHSHDEKQQFTTRKPLGMSTNANSGPDQSSSSETEVPETKYPKSNFTWTQGPESKSPTINFSSPQFSETALQERRPSTSHHHTERRRSSTTKLPSRRGSSAKSRCTVPTCPLNEFGIPHHTGLYLHNGVTEKNYFIFGEANPHPLIHLAQSRQEQAMNKLHRGENPTVNRLIAQEMAGVVRRFIELHCR